MSNEWAEGTRNAELDGLEVSLYRGEDGRLVVDIATGDLTGDDVHAPHDVPNIRIWINEQKLTILPSGELEEQ